MLLLLAMYPGFALAQLAAKVDPLSYPFSGGYGQVEVGGRYAGAEFHSSRPLPSRISFYYPVANSVDLSTDYWKRGDSRPMAVCVRADRGPLRWIGREAWDYVLSPHRVTFHSEEDSLAYTMRYEFGFAEPIVAYQLTVKNIARRSRYIQTYAHLKASIRTCQTYARFDTAWMSFDSAHSAALARFDAPQVGGTTIVVENAGDPPEGAMLDPSRNTASDTGTSSTVTLAEGVGWTQGAIERKSPALVAFTYARQLKPGDSLSIVLLLGSCRSDERKALVSRIGGTWRKDVDAYDRFIREKAAVGAAVSTGDPWVDRSILWSNALLAANAHYLDGVVVPMPCPAEYNFFFTHDMLLTDLAAIAFDPERVRRDLTYIAGLAKDSVIPHAYYWRDDGFKTEYCPPDDWNHLWFILVAGAYLRHTQDTVFGERIYPLVTKSLRQALLRLQGDHLMHALAPDWWDIGKNEGSRAYMTILISRALHEYLFISSYLQHESGELLKYEQIADQAIAALTSALWDKKVRYLINFNGSVEDRHYYMGSLLAPVFGFLDRDRARELVTTATQELVAPRVGVRTVMPPDFHTDSLRSFFHFAGNEAGDPYLYANGGVWPHNNALYTLALRATGRTDDAFAFFRTTMTLDGIAHSPAGQPAMYEYRYSDTASPEYGRIDKPSFLWAAGFTLFTAYRFAGIDDDEWNISIGGEIPSSLDSVMASFEFHGRKSLVRTGLSRGRLSFMADGAAIPSLVVPLDAGKTSTWVVNTTGPDAPLLEKINAILRSAEYDPVTRRLRLGVSSFQGHSIVAQIVVVRSPSKVTVNGRPIRDVSSLKREDGRQGLTIRFTGSSSIQNVILQF